MKQSGKEQIAQRDHAMSSSSEVFDPQGDKILGSLVSPHSQAWLEKIVLRIF